MEFDNFHPLGAIAFAEARGQSGPEAVEEIVLKKFKVVNEVLIKHQPAEVDPPGWPHPEGPDDPRSDEENRIIFNPGTCSI